MKSVFFLMLVLSQAAFSHDDIENPIVARYCICEGDAPWPYGYAAYLVLINEDGSESKHQIKLFGQTFGDSKKCDQFIDTAGVCR